MQLDPRRDIFRTRWNTGGFMARCGQPVNDALFRTFTGVGVKKAFTWQQRSRQQSRGKLPSSKSTKRGIYNNPRAIFAYRTNGIIYYKNATDVRLNPIISCCGGSPYLFIIAPVIIVEYLIKSAFLACSCVPQIPQIATENNNCA